MKSLGTWTKAIIYMVIFVVVLLLIPQPIDWKAHFGKDSDNPYGGSLIYESLDQIFTQGIEINNRPFYLSLDTILEEQQNLVVVTNYFALDSLDRSKLLEYVDRGNDVFITGQYYDNQFLELFGLRTESMLNGTYTNPDYSYANFGNSQIKQDTSYSFKGSHYEWYFEKIVKDSLYSTITAISWGDDIDKPNYVKVNYGDGTLYLHSNPIAFTNYHLLKPDNERYIGHAFSHLEDRVTVWDEYYKPQRVDAEKGILHVIVSKPALRWAYWIGFVSLFLYILFMAKRTQRIIPVVEPYVNDSVNFMKTMGGLYYKQSNHSDIAIKKIKIFQDYIARTYYIRDFKNNEKYVLLLAQKSGHDRQLVEKILKLIDRVRNDDHVSEGLLRILNKNINTFYRR